MNNKIFSIIGAVVLSFNGCSFAQNSKLDRQIIEMLSSFYCEYNAVWSSKPSFTTVVLERKLDSLNAIYCTSELRKAAKISLEGEYGQDLLTNGFPGIDSFDNLNIVKDIKIENGYIVSYTHIFNDIPGKPQKNKVILHVSVVKEGDIYKISDVK